jgi:hypothetical protein
VRARRSDDSDRCGWPTSAGQCLARRSSLKSAFNSSVADISYRHQFGPRPTAWVQAPSPPATEMRREAPASAQDTNEYMSPKQPVCPQKSWPVTRRRTMASHNHGGGSGYGGRGIPPSRPVASAASRGGRLASPTMLLTAGSCDRRLDHGKVGRHAQPVTPASQVAFRRFLRAEMHDPAEAGSKKGNCSPHLGEVVHG